METSKKHCMLTIVDPVNLLVSDEYDRAAKLHGAVFASPHEGYGRQLLLAIREEKPRAMIDLADYIRDTAVNAAAECIQVAAMCEKLVRTVRKPDETAV